ncbi:uncharacterized protein LOC114066103 [Empidonax traillii]|uniref:uncharacterized protein LOC114066103 n=1 Tax=Empidonax traillii TaxID=164674 RepID=UPI000FFD00D1|nr:uncharacterized protein LOC114066103 [Empidonax traillii]
MGFAGVEVVFFGGDGSDSRGKNNKLRDLSSRQEERGFALAARLPEGLSPHPPIPAGFAVRPCPGRDGLQVLERGTGFGSGAGRRHRGKEPLRGREGGQKCPCSSPVPLSCPGTDEIPGKAEDKEP